MTVCGGATRLRWWLACLLAGCVQQGDQIPDGQIPDGAFGRTRGDLFAAPDAATQASSGRAAVIDQDKPVAPQTKIDALRSPVIAGASAQELAASASSQTALAVGPMTHKEAGDATATEPPVAIIKPGASSDPLVAETSAAGRQRGEHELRNAFAHADQQGLTEAALDLAGFLVRGERYFDALHVIDLALKRHRTVPLRLARAGLLRDVARCDLAAVELQGVVRDLGASRVSPATLLDLAQAQWVNGDQESAAATMRSIQSQHADDLWQREHADELALWQKRIAQTSPILNPVANGELRDMFALLRAAPVISGRLKMLDRLAAPPVSAPADAAPVDEATAFEQARQAVRMRAIAIACADESAAVRTRAVYLAADNGLNDRAFWQVALQDAAPLVRRFAAVGAAKMLGKVVAPDLLAALAAESDERAFGSLHESLAKALATPLPACDVHTEQGRQAAVAHWKSQCRQ